MRSIGLIIVIIAAFTWAEETPPPPRIMNIYMKGGAVESVLCSRLDPDVGVTFVENSTKMKVGVRDLVDPTIELYDLSTLWFCTSQIDSITFDLIGPPPEPEPVVP